jgi:teichuronic acid biosynthesis glycosyltransferase TuaC
MPSPRSSPSCRKPLQRTLFVTTSYPAYPGDPSGHFIQTEARFRARAGDSVVVLAPRPALEPITEHRSDDGSLGIRVLWLEGGDAFGWPGALTRLRQRPARIASAFRFALAARRALREEGPFDRTFAHFVVPSGWPLCVRTGGALEVVAHGSDIALFERLPRLLRRKIAADLLEAGARFRFVSRDLESRFVRASLASVLDRSRVEPCAIDVSEAPTRAEARARLGIGGERVGVIVGRLVESKDPERAVRLATARLDRVIVIGDGPLAERVRRAHPAVSLSGKLARPDTLTWIAAADLLVSASREEGASTVVREARALGTPVLAVAAGDIAERARVDPGITVVSSDEGVRQKLIHGSAA